MATPKKTNLQKMPYGTGGAPREIRTSTKNKGPTDFEVFQESLRAREGVELEIYDHEGVLHGGVGHKLVGEELKKYKLGDPISEELSERWLKEDSEKAWKTAGEKAKELKKPEFQSILAPLDYQLGGSWHKDHKKTWKLLQKGDYKGAAVEVEDSKWFREQSPTRVKDFQHSLYGLAGMLRRDGTVKSERGYLGPMSNVDGSTMTEFSTDMEVDGEIIDIPTMVHGQSAEALEYMRHMEGGQGFNLEIPEERDIVDVARKAAMERLRQGKSVWYQDGEELEDGPTLGTSNLLNGN